MASNNTKKQVHVSPGIYFSESELSVATKSLGITNLGLAGETVKGPAFQPIEISSWAQYQSYFGGTSTEKFRGSQYPKYELPYIAKTYLEESQNLKVCRVLGLSGVNAGPAWFITAYYGSDTTPTDGVVRPYTITEPMVVAVLRSRGEHQKAVYKGQGDDETTCGDQYHFDNIIYYAKSVELIRTSALKLDDGCNPTFSEDSEDTSEAIEINANNYGRFGLKVTTYAGQEVIYQVSLNPDDSNYIYNVIGGNPEVGDAEIYVEELYDVALAQLIEQDKLNKIGQIGELNGIFTPPIVSKYEPIDDYLTKKQKELTKKDVGKRFIYDGEEGITVGKKGDAEPEDRKIYTVKMYVTDTGERTYYYEKDDETKQLKSYRYGASPVEPDGSYDVCDEYVFMKNYGLYCYIEQKSENEFNLKLVKFDMNNYKEEYRYASTPWIVSELKGSARNVELTKLFRFHTISDGTSASYETKISIENIDTEAGTFDVLVRDFNDTDASPVVLERFNGVNLIPGSENYIALRIGSFDESYETKSSYITVEVNENEKTMTSIPAGFLGYPVRDFSLTKPFSKIYGSGGLDRLEKFQHAYLQYNVNVDEDKRPRKQYFGMSDLVGIDTDILKYKGVYAYNEDPKGLTPCFHLDSRIFNGIPNEQGVITDGDIPQTVSVDGVTGYEWVTVGKGNTLNNYGIEPRIGNEDDMYNTIYEDKRYRKFTLCFYGGFDGWDYYRTSRSNTDDFKYQRYRGNINDVSGDGENFTVITNPELYGFDKYEKAITSDWYAYMSAIRQFANPKEIDINVFATPGIDYVNNNTLVGDTIEMIEEERADSIYVITTPDKPFGAGDYKSEMYSAEEVVDNLDESEIDSNWACTYYPWIKYFDSVNNQYIYLPPTKDVVKNFAYTDNVAAPWYAAAGWNRGLSDGVKSKKNLVLSEQNELYSGRINFINNFADEGMRIWGDKNLQIAESKAHMNRISKRRCLIRLRKLISIACIGLIFDPNDPTATSSFRSAVQPILEDFISKRALTDAKLVVDDSQESRERLEINAQIYLKFMPNTEYINIGLVATPEGVSFDDI